MTTTLTTSYEWHDLPLADPFTISRGTTEVSENVVVRIEDDQGTVGVGGGCPADRYDESRETVAAVLPDLLAVVEDVGDPHGRQRIERRMREVVGGSRADAAARAAVEIALHDLACKRLGVPLYRDWGLDPREAVRTCFTVGLDSTDRMAEKAREAADAGFEVLKVKLGTGRDVDVVAAISDAAPDVRLRVDANEAWGPGEAVEMTRVLADYDVEFVEQPVPADDPAGMARVSEDGALPVAADESCVVLEDVPAVAGIADVAVIKLMKCGGLAEARRMIHAARAHGLEVMLGCMTESNASIAAGAQLAPLLDYADLDGSLLLERDPVAGVPMPGGRIELDGFERPGTGARFE